MPRPPYVRFIGTPHRKALPWNRDGRSRPFCPALSRNRPWPLRPILLYEAMARKRPPPRPVSARAGDNDYAADLAGVTQLLESARHAAARSVNAVMTSSYWEVGRRIVESEQGGKRRVDYGARLVERLSVDLTRRFGRGFGVVNLTQMRKFYQLWAGPEIVQTPSEESPSPGGRAALPRTFPLSWSHYVRLMSLGNPEARAFYETESLRGGWSVRQLDRQIGT
jgi:hypothetical protein